MKNNIQRFRDTEIRIEALKAAAKVHEGKGSAAATITTAKKFEEYLKGK